MEIGPLASIVAAIAAMASAFISWRVYKRQSGADAPVIEITVKPHDTVANWWRIVITMTNRSDVRWRATTAVVTEPRRAKLIRAYDKAVAKEGHESVPGDLSAFSNTAALILETAPAGTNPGRFHWMGSADTHFEPLLLHVPPSTRSRTLSMRLSLASNEAVQRQTAIVVKRTLPAATSTANA